MEQRRLCYVADSLPMKAYCKILVTDSIGRLDIMEMLQEASLGMNENQTVLQTEGNEYNAQFTEA